eukprot:TRINITY_DN4732_c0_g1_i3.p3 TRINITY_DN4732_c0_g1~~TRINITY_DN4732_c0_g1_i3.p3  ORF type:complete len:72 (+),score=15.67 TRINITY_DN4732_c0_g1_i3:314-529(+)
MKIAKNLQRVECIVFLCSQKERNNLERCALPDCQMLVALDNNYCTTLHEQQHADPKPRWIQKMQLFPCSLS